MRAPATPMPQRHADQEQRRHLPFVQVITRLEMGRHLHHALSDQ
jgi:hypothetical protein